MTAGLAFAVLAALAYGASDFVGGLFARRVSPWQIAFSGQLGGAAAIAAVAVTAVDGSPTGVDFGWAALGGIGGAIGSAFLYRGLSAGRMGLVAPVSAVGAAMLPLGIGVLTGDRPAPVVWLGVCVALPGIWLVSRSADSGARRERDLAAIRDGVLAGLGFGILFAGVGQVPASAGAFPLVVQCLAGAVATLVIAAVLRQPWLPRAAHEWTGLSAGAVGALGTAAFVAAAQHANLSIAGVLSSTYPVFTVALAAVALRERVLLGQAWGMALCVTSVALVAVG
jgi:drug/metabolite transporter (DMT)-like permease